MIPGSAGWKILKKGQVLNVSHEYGYRDCLDTVNILVFIKGRDIMLKEPSVAAIDKPTGKIIAAGSETRRMLGRTSGNIVAIRPLRDGVIVD